MSSELWQYIIIKEEKPALTNFMGQKLIKFGKRRFIFFYLTFYKKYDIILL
jgi:hypothetical protein